MAKKITDVEKMKTLWKEGVISKSTYYRGKKRGHIIIDYHKPHEVRGEEEFSPEKFWGEVSELYVKLAKIANRAISTYSAHGVFCPDELINEGVIYLLEKRVYPSEGLAHFKSYVISLIRGNGKNIPGSWRDKHLSYDEQWEEDDEFSPVVHHGESLF